MSPTDAYLLGSMPRRLFHVRNGSREDGDEAFREVRRLADLWLAFLDALKDRSVRPSVQQLHDRLTLEQEQVDAQKRHQRNSMLHQLANDAIDPPPLPEPPKAIPPAPDSLALALALVSRPEHAQLREKLPLELRELHEMGYLVAECRWGDVGQGDTTRIWTLAKKWNVEEWVTERPPGSPLEPGETIHKLVMDHAKEIDELFLTQPINPPEPASEEMPSGPYLTIPEVATLLKVGEDTIERLINTGQLKASEVSGKGKAAGRKVKRIRREAVEEFMKRAEGTVTPIIERRRPRQRKPPGETDYIH